MLNWHDHEWCKLNLDEHYLFEILTLVTFQSGLTWLMILRKRENFRKAFDNFNVDKVAKFSEKDVERLLNDKGIIRNRRKIEAVINNARILNAWHQQGKTLHDFLVKYIPQPIVYQPKSYEDVLTKTPLTTKMAKELKKAGFKFIGPVTMYSYLQSVGLINDHLVGCSFKYKG